MITETAWSDQVLVSGGLLSQEPGQLIRAAAAWAHYLPSGLARSPGLPGIGGGGPFLVVPTYSKLEEALLIVVCCAVTGAPLLQRRLPQ